VIEPDATEIAILHSGPVIRNRTKLRHSRTHQPFVRRKLFECPEPAAGRDESHQIAWLDLLLHKALEREDNGRWIAEALEIPGVMCYGTTREEAIGNTERLAIEVIADRIAHGEMPASSLNLSFVLLDEQMARS